MSMMNAVQVIRPKAIRQIQTEKPALDSHNNILVKMTAAGICGSDGTIYHGTNAIVTYPRIIGHEMVGIVEKAAENAERLKPGDRVIINQVVSCGRCYACRKGRGNVCDHLKVRGVHIDGGFREYIAVPESDCYLLPDCITDQDAFMIEPATIAIQACTRAQLASDDMVLILGYGALGSSVLRIARLLCRHIIVACRTDEKLENARKNGAQYTINVKKEDLTEKVLAYTEGHGSTVSIDAANSEDSLPALLKATGNAGRVMVMGLTSNHFQISPSLITAKELDVRGSRLQNHMFEKAIQMVQEGTLDLKGNVSHTFPLSKVQEAFDLIDSRDPSVRKVVLTF